MTITAELRWRVLFYNVWCALAAAQELGQADLIDELMALLAVIEKRRYHLDAEARS